MDITAMIAGALTGLLIFTIGWVVGVVSGAYLDFYNKNKDKEK